MNIQRLLSLQTSLLSNNLFNFSRKLSPDFIKDIFRIIPSQLSQNNPYKARNFVNGQWKEASHYRNVIDPMNGQKFLHVPDTYTEGELKEFTDSMQNCPKSGLHNPLKNPERYVMYGEICHKAAYLLGHPVIEDYFTQLIQRVTPKHDVQARAEVRVTQRFLMNFSGDQCRFLTRSFNVSGDHYGQQSSGYRWPYGPVAIICPFNFPLEIPVLQMLGALMTGNKVLIKGDSRVSIVLEKFLELLHFAGLPADDCNLIHCEGPHMEQLLKMTDFRMVQFTGSSLIAEKISEIKNGLVKLEDAGFDWKILGPDVSDFEYVAWQSDQDAYAFSGQKCSAQSILFAHKNWVEKGIIDRLTQLASRRTLNDLSICPVLTWNNTKIQQHVDQVMKVKGAQLLFGGRALEQGTHTIPEIYGSYYPTAIHVPLKEIIKKENFNTVMRELFGPFQIVTTYDDHELDDVLNIMEKIPHNLTAGIVSNDQTFQNKVLANTINGVTYAGIRARTTGAPQNHWFGPCGDPRGAGIGSPEAILQTWTSHREIIKDQAHVPSTWTLPKSS